MTYLLLNHKQQLVQSLNVKHCFIVLTLNNYFYFFGRVVSNMDLYF